MIAMAMMRVQLAGRCVVERVLADEALALRLLREQTQARTGGTQRAHHRHRLNEDQLACFRVHWHIVDAALGLAVS